MSSWHSGRLWLCLGLTLMVGSASFAAFAQQVGYGGERYGFGTPATKADIAAWKTEARPDGLGLPPGAGTYQAGAQVYAEQCASCHVANHKGLKDKNLPQGGGPALIGGRGTLATAKAVKTVESYWPYAVTLFDYIRRAMPYTAPGSLKANEIYALCAYILGEANIIDKNTTIDAASLPKVMMPNRNGFYPDDRPFPVMNYSARLFPGEAEPYSAQVATTPTK